ncbi:Late transcription factor VLTF-4 (1), partial [Monkeypox virus]
SPPPSSSPGVGD